MEKSDSDLINEFGLNDLNEGAFDGNPLVRERLEDVYEEISLTRGTSTVGVQLDDENNYEDLTHFLD